MATILNRLEFKQNYDSYSQGLFLVTEEKRLPKNQEIINLGKELSSRLIEYRKEDQKVRVLSVLSSLFAPFQAVSLTRIEILFTPYLELDPVKTIGIQCRNRKICLLWPGFLVEKRAIYAEPGVPEYYENDLTQFQETYIIKD